MSGSDPSDLPGIGGPRARGRNPGTPAPGSADRPGQPLPGPWPQGEGLAVVPRVRTGAALWPEGRAVLPDLRLDGLARCPGRPAARGVAAGTSADGHGQASGRIARIAAPRRDAMNLRGPPA